MTTAFELFRSKLEEAGCSMKGSGDRQLSAQCPAHEDRNPSLSVTNGNSRVLVRCHAGCDTDEILAKLGLTRADLFNEEGRPETSAGRDEIVAVYDYVDEDGRLLFQVCRTTAKQFPQRVPDGAGGWRWRLGETRRVLYRLPAIIAAADAGQLIYIAEGEKDVHALEAAGVVATCNPGGAGKWQAEYSPVFREATVVVVADRDKAGEAHARTVARSLRPIAREVRIVESAVGKDAADHFAAGLTVADLVETTPPDRAGVPDLAPDLHEFLGLSFPREDWVFRGFLERGDRLIITGGEGRGKSLFTRQLAIAAAAGLSPFNEPEDPDPLKVLFIDCENSERKSQKYFRKLAGVAAKVKSVEQGRLRLIHRPEGLDLFRDDDAWLLERVTAHQPDLLIVGPLYRLHVADVNEETAARAVVTALDACRLAVNCALIVEAHSPHEEIRGKRVLRPAGSSLFLRWPEMGLGIRAAGTEDEWERDHVARLEQWRGPRDDRYYPSKIKWGNRGPEWSVWPWQPVWDREAGHDSWDRNTLQGNIVQESARGSLGSDF